MSSNDLTIVELTKQLADCIISPCPVRAFGTAIDSRRDCKACGGMPQVLHVLTAAIKERLADDDSTLLEPAEHYESELEYLVSQLDTNLFESLTSVTSLSARSCVYALALWLQELPEPLLGNVRHDDDLSAAEFEKEISSKFGPVQANIFHAIVVLIANERRKVDVLSVVSLTPQQYRDELVAVLAPSLFSMSSDIEASVATTSIAKRFIVRLVNDLQPIEPSGSESPVLASTLRPERGRTPSSPSLSPSLSSSFDSPVTEDQEPEPEVDFRSASLEELLLKLTSPMQPNTSFQFTFLLTYRSFMTADDLLERLKSQYFGTEKLIKMVLHIFAN